MTDKTFKQGFGACLDHLRKIIQNYRLQVDHRLLIAVDVNYVPPERLIPYNYFLTSCNKKDDEKRSKLIFHRIHIYTRLQKR